RRRSREPAEPPAMGAMGGRESLSTHMEASSGAVVLSREERCASCLASARKGTEASSRRQAQRRRRTGSSRQFRVHLMAKWCTIQGSHSHPEEEREKSSWQTHW